MRRAPRVDGNQSLIVDYFRKRGCSVAITAGVADGFPDLVVSKSGRTALVEVKDPAQPKNKRALKPDQVKFHSTWQGAIYVVETLDRAGAVVEILEGRE